jgi:23S rRNA pseudouridine2605 synthase
MREESRAAAPKSERSGERPPERPERAGERIAKRLARAGLCSRREAERWIADGRVSVDGEVITSPAVTVTASSIVAVDGRVIAAPERARLWRYHKPRGLVCVRRDPKGRPTIFERLPAGLPRVLAVGGLDAASEGLILLTNDGALARRLELPSHAWIRRYRVRAFGRVEEPRLAELAKGLTVAGIAYGPIEAKLDRISGANAWLTVALHEGRNRDIRRVTDHLGLKVSRLIRTAFGPFQLGNLPEGQVAEVPAKVIAEQMGAAFAAKPERREEGAGTRDADHGREA